MIIWKKKKSCFWNKELVAGTVDPVLDLSLSHMLSQQGVNLIFPKVNIGKYCGNTNHSGDNQF